MDCYHADDELEVLEFDANARSRYPHAIQASFRRKMLVLRCAPDERTLRSLKSLHFERLEPPRSHQHSIRLNDQYRLILELEKGAEKRVRVVGIEDYH